MGQSTYRISMDKRWDLEDLYLLPHAYSQNYAFVYCFDTTLDPRDAERIDYALQGYPWRGGYSYVNIYTVLKHQVPSKERPKIAAIQYASPGWIDLALNPDVAMQIAKSVGIYLCASVGAGSTYRKINSILAKINEERARARNAQLKLARAEAIELAKLTQELAKSWDFNSVNQLTHRTGDAEVATRLLMAHYRRMKILGDYVLKGKARFPENLRDDG